MQSAIWLTLLLMVAMCVDCTQGAKRRRCQCPKVGSGNCNIPSGCRCPIVKKLCRKKPQSTFVGKRNAGVQLPDLDFLNFNRHLREAEELLELQNKNIYSSPRFRRWKTND